jgi:hypothetical protein
MIKKYVIVLSLCLAVTASASVEIGDGLIGYWPMDEGAGDTVEDISTNSNNGTIQGDPQWTDGKFGSALAFDGVDDYVLCAERDGTEPGTYPEELMPDNFSVSSWTKLDNFAYFSAFVGNGMDTSADECGFFLYNYGWVGDNTQDFGLAIRTETAMHYVETPNIYETGTWYHLAATYDGADVGVYVDGEPVELSADPGASGGPIRWISASSGNYPERFAIGVWLDPGYDLWVDGVIDDVGYWNRALTADEVAYLYNDGAGRPIPEPMTMCLLGLGALMLRRRRA